MRGNTIIRVYLVSDIISHSVDTEISASHPESWSEGISGNNFSEGNGGIAWLRDNQVQILTPNSSTN